jgi:heptosyltransferase III
MTSPTAITKPVTMRILAINVSRIGDTLLAIPALRAIAQAYPQAEITVLGHPKRVEVLEHLPFLHQVGSISKRWAPMRGWLKKEYELAFVWGYDAALVAYALRSAHSVVAFRQADEKLNRKLFKVVEPYLFQSSHAVNLAMTIPAAIGIVTSGHRLAYHITEQEAYWAKKTLSTNLPEKATPLIGLQIASFPTKAYRDWPLDNFFALCERLLKTYPNTHFLIFGGTEESLRTEALKRHLGNTATLYAGRLSIRETAALMSVTDLYIGVDTGPTHIMSAFDIPMVVMYHCISSSKNTGPLDHPCAYLIDHPAGSGCSEWVSMSDISVDTVFQQAKLALTEHPPKTQ